MRSSRHVAVVTAAYPPIAGGAELQLHAIAQGLTGLGWRVTVITGLPARLAETCDGEVAIRCLGAPGKSGVSAGMDFVRKAVPLLGSMRPSVVLASMIGSNAVAAGVYARMFNRPSVVRLSGQQVGGTSRLIELAQSRHGRMMLGVALPSRTLIVAPSQHLINDASQVLNGRGLGFAVIPNAVADGHGAAREVAYEGRPHVVAWYSNGLDLKNPDLLTAVAKALPDVDFVAVGNGALSLPRLPNLQRIRWVADVPEMWRRVRVVLNTSAFEGSPNFVLQGLSGGCLAVGVPNPGMLELAGLYPQHVRLSSGDDAASVVEQLTLALRGPYESPPPQVPNLAFAIGRWDAALSQLINARKHGSY